MKRAFAALVLPLLAMLLSACGGDDDGPVTGSGTEQPAPTGIAATVVALPTGVVNVCADNPSPQATAQPSDFGYRKLSQPAPGMVVRSPLTIVGEANPFEGAFAAQLISVPGQVIARQDYSKDNQRLAFSVQLPFSVTAATQACLWVFERSGRDGSPVNITQVPITLQP